MTSRKELFGWNPDHSPTLFERHVVLPGRVFERVPPFVMWRATSAALNRVNPDVVAVNGYSYYDAWSAFVWCKMHRRAVIITCDSRLEDAHRSALREFPKRFIINQCDAALCAGRSSRVYLEHLGMKPNKIFEGLDVVDNDFFWQQAEKARSDPESYRSMPGLESSEPFFLASNRFVKGKNLDRMLQAYAIYRQRVLGMQNSLKPWRMVLLGDGVERQNLEKLVQNNDIQGVSFVGFRQICELPIYHGLSSAFIHPSLQDTWGLVVNEALAAGTPILISKRIGCVPDLVVEGKNGFSFDPNDTEQIASLMWRISTGHVDLSDMRQASRDIINQWGPRRFAEGIYQALQVAIR
jgi:glycosyltransferase involved in cell wall biosynthesis